MQPPETNSDRPRRVLCAVPPTGLYVREDRCQTPMGRLKTIALRPPIDMMYAAGVFEAAGCECRLVDFPAEGLGFADFERTLRDFAPDLVLLSATTMSMAEDLRAAEVARAQLPDACIAAKGAYFNTLDLETLARAPALDLVMRAEIEGQCAELAQGRPLAEIAGISWRTASGELRRNPDRDFDDDLDAIPFPARHLTNNALYRRPDTGAIQTTLVTNRGCPFHCSYCLANQTSGERNRYRSVENVIAEIEHCVREQGIRSFLFRSELFTQRGAWVRELCAAIEASGLDIEWACNSRVDTIDLPTLRAMRRAGCWIIAFGVESGDQSVLDRMQKKARADKSFQAIADCRAAGVRSSVYLIYGMPWDDRQSADRQLEFARRLDPDVLEIFFPYPFPGTPLTRELVEAGLLREGEIPPDGYAVPAVPSKHLSIEALAAERRRILRGFYLRPRKVAATLTGARSRRELVNYLRVGAAQLRQITVGS